MNIPPAKAVFEKKDRQEILSRIDECLSSGMLTQGKYVQEFEKRWAEYVGVKHAIGVNSGSSAIEISMRILGIEGKEVLVPTNTFAATAEGVSRAGGRVRFIDTDPSTFSISLEDLQTRRTPDTVGIIIVHIGGIVTPKIQAIRRWCEEKNLWLFEDCAHAHGSEYDNKQAGTFGIAGGFSFFATKVMTTGEGGMIVTNDDKLTEYARLFRNHGKPEPWVSYHTHLGSNWRMSELNAILGLTQLKRLDEFIAWRSDIARLYTELLEDVPELTPILPSSRSSWYKYIVLLPKEVNRSVLKQLMKEYKIGLSGEVYEVPLHKQPIFKDITEGNFPMADDICSRHICLPIYYGMKQDEVHYVINVLKKILLKTKL